MKYSGSNKDTQLHNMHNVLFLSQINTKGCNMHNIHP